MGVKDVHVLEAHAPEALIEAGQNVLARAPLAIGPRPHAEPRLGGDDHLVAVGGHVLVHDPAKGLLGRAGRRAIVVRQVEMGDAQVKGAPHHGAGVLERVHAAKVVPKPEGDGRQEEPAHPTPPVRHRSIAMLIRLIHHDTSSCGKSTQRRGEEKNPTPRRKGAKTQRGKGTIMALPMRVAVAAPSLRTGRLEPFSLSSRAQRGISAALEQGTRRWRRADLSTREPHVLDVPQTAGRPSHPSLRLCPFASLRFFLLFPASLRLPAQQTGRAALRSSYLLPVVVDQGLDVALVEGANLGHGLLVQGREVGRGGVVLHLIGALGAGHGAGDRLVHQDPA